MGSQESKLEQPPQEEPENDPIPTESAPSTPILTPLDPRSPSVNIARTPLETVLGPKEVKDVENVVLGVDPRSPTVEFTRTPIIVATVPKEKSTKLQNRNLENVRKLEIQTTPVSALKSPNIVPPKLLDSTPISAVQNKRKSFVGLLETNIDFTETDLDTVQAKNTELNQSLPVVIPEEVPCNKLKDQMEALKIEGVEKCEKLERVEEKLVNITAQVKDFDKKLTNLIYEDDGDYNMSTVKAGKIKEHSRTPLGVRNSNEDDKRTWNRLKVSDKPRRSEISKIPVFKDYHCRKSMGVQCENTPPRKLEEAVFKNKVSHWDADKTLII